MKIKRIVSGVQPSGVLHLGNYLGAIKGWTNSINKYHSYLSDPYINENNEIKSKLIFFIADNHSITSKFLKDENKYYNVKELEDDKNLSNPKKAGENYPVKLSDLVTITAACLIASGIDHKKCIFFRQSDVKQHAELMWILSCITPQSWLNTMIQYKEKSKNNQLITSLGLYTYPILMASDIMLYNAEVVPVGEDQVQHMDLTKRIAERLNKLCGENIINVPEYELNKQGARIMSLQNAKKKMSKSDETKNSCISLLEKKDDLRNLIMKAKTDNISEIYYDNLNRPEVSNLINIYSCITGISYDEIKQIFHGKSFFDFKTSLVDVLSKEIIPISEKAENILNDKSGFLDEILHKGSLEASAIAEKNLYNIKKLLHFYII